MNTATVKATGAPVLQAHDLCFGFAQRALFSDFSAQIPPGVTWVCGDESCGKTTLLRLMAGELPAESGALQVNGIQLTRQPQVYRSQVFWADPRTLAFDTLTPHAYWAGVRRQYPAFAENLLADLIDGFALAGHLEKSLYMLSTGTKRKIFLAAAFASGAAITLLDEPFAALDKASTAMVLELLQDAALHPSRAWVLADYVAPRGLGLAATLALGTASGCSPWTAEKNSGTGPGL